MAESQEDTFFTAKLAPGGPGVEWTLYDLVAGTEEAVFQSGPRQSCPHREIIPFVRACLVALRVGVTAKTKLPVPDGRVLLDGETDVDPAASTPVLYGPYEKRKDLAEELAKLKDPLARLMWRYWTSIHVPASFFGAWPKFDKRVGYKWRLWYNIREGTCEASFQAFTADGKVNPAFDFDRRPLNELPEAMTASDKLAEVFKEFGQK